MSSRSEYFIFLDTSCAFIKKHFNACIGSCGGCPGIHLVILKSFPKGPFHVSADFKNAAYPFFLMNSFDSLYFPYL